jgi:putative membrane protein
MSKVMPITGALAVAMLAAAPGASAQVAAGQDSSAADTAYIRQVIRGNFLEVGLGRRAYSRGADSAVKQFALRMISDHNSMNDQWTELAEQNDMAIRLEVGPAGQQVGERLEDLEGAEFDRAYMREMIRQHEQDLAFFQRMARWAGTLEVRQLASSGVPTLQDHLALARQVGSRVGISTTAGRTGAPVPAPTPSADTSRRTVGVPAPVPTTSGDTGRRTTAGRTTRDARNDRGDRDDRDDRSRLRAEDRRFVQNVLQDHLMHIRLAERAQREARSNQTRRLAERIGMAFEDWQERWEDLADRYDVKAPSHLGQLHAQKVERLERASRANVDRTYVSIVADHLASVVPYFEKEGQEVRSAPVRRLVDDELPLIRDALARARQLDRQASARAEESDRD